MHYLFGQLSHEPIDDDRAVAILREAASRRAEFRRVPLDRILGILDRVARRWSDPAYELRQRVLTEAPAQIGFSPPMVEKELEGLCMALGRDYLENKIRHELGSLAPLDHWQGGHGNAFLRALPRGIVLHVASGNALTVGVLSMVEGIVTKNVNLLKAASRATLLPLCLAQSLAEVDTEGLVAPFIAVLSWPGGRSQVHRVFQQGCDAIVVWGSEEVVKTYREGLALKNRLIEYGPKVSFAAISAECLGHPDTARQAARAVALWDQTACSSPQVLYVEDADPERRETRSFVERLSRELAELQRVLPLGPLDLQERAELTKERELAEVTEAMQRGELHTPGRAPDWTVIAEWDPAFKLSPLFRTIYVKPMPTLDALPPLIEPYADYVQTAGIAASPQRVLALAERLFDRGLLRVTTLGEMTGGSPGEPHDGGFALQALVKWVSLGFAGEKERYDAEEWVDPQEQQRNTFARLKRLVEDLAPRAPFYRHRLQDLTLCGWQDWYRVPVLSREELQRATPPRSEQIFTEPPAGAHFLRSGGSTGEPKLSVFAYDDYEADMARAARGLYALGLRRGDRVANLFMAGHLYGSFLSINRAVELVGCNSFPFTHHTPAAELPPLLRAFGIEVLMGLPSWLLEVCDAISRAGQGVRIRKVFYTGEHLYPEARERLRREFGVEVIGSIGYGAVDAGPIGYQCTAGEGGVHHLHADHQFLEIVDPESLQPLPPGESGDILVTNLNRRLMPLLRYRIGDRARWVSGTCPCGRASPRFELLGRSDDYVVAGGINVAFADIHAAAAQVEGLAGPTQLVVSRRGNRDMLTLKVEGDGTLPPDALADRLRERVMDKLAVLRQAVVSGRLHPLLVEVVPPGGIERVQRTGKIRRVIDQRLESRTED